MGKQLVIYICGVPKIYAGRSRSVTANTAAAIRKKTGYILANE